MESLSHRGCANLHMSVKIADLCDIFGTIQESNFIGRVGVLRVCTPPAGNKHTCHIEDLLWSNTRPLFMLKAHARWWLWQTVKPCSYNRFGGVLRRKEKDPQNTPQTWQVPQVSRLWCLASRTATQIPGERKGAAAVPASCLDSYAVPGCLPESTQAGRSSSLHNGRVALCRRTNTLTTRCRTAGKAPPTAPSQRERG